jgi:hypothetical protein
MNSKEKTHCVGGMYHPQITVFYLIVNFYFFPALLISKHQATGVQESNILNCSHVYLLSGVAFVA